MTGKYQKYTQQQCNRVAQLRKQGLSWRLISERLGASEGGCRSMLKRAQ